MVSESADNIKELALRLFEIEAFKFGEFVLKSGLTSPVYFDLRVIISYPDVMSQLTDLLFDFSQNLNLKYDHVCGVPYTALPIATLLSVKQSKPMLIRRKEAKGYGTKKLIEGKFAVGDSCLIIEDVITSGSSILETVKDLKNEHIIVTDAVVVVDREQGATANIARDNVNVHSLFKLSTLLGILLDAGKIDADTVTAVSKFIADSQIVKEDVAKQSTKVAEQVVQRIHLSFEARAALAKNAVAQKLFRLMHEKRSNLCVAADVTNSAELLRLADAIGPYICALKTHIDAIDDFTPELIASLQSLAKMHNFLLFEDRKFADIGNTVALQYGQGVYRISEWADLVTVHALPGPGILKGLQTVADETGAERGVFLLAELSSSGHLCSAEYISQSLALAASSFVAGIVCQSREVVRDAGLIQLTPGVRIDEKSDGLGQQYDTPEHVVQHKGADVAVVGRGIYAAKDAAVAAKLYRSRLWDAYEQRLADK